MDEKTITRPEVNELKENVGHIEHKIENLNENVKLVLQAITGNPLTRDGGMVKDMENLNGKVEDLDKRMEKKFDEVDARLESTELFQKRMSWTWTIIVFTVSVLTGLISLLIAYLSFKK